MSEKFLEEITKELQTYWETGWKMGWKACRDMLIQNGCEIGTDFYDENGNVIGRYHGFFPKGSTPENRVSHYREMIAIEEAAKAAVPLNFGDLKWVEEGQ